MATIETLFRSKKTIKYLTLCHQNGIIHLFGRHGKPVLKCVHQGEPVFKTASFPKKRGRFLSLEKVAFDKTDQSERISNQIGRAGQASGNHCHYG